MSAALFSRALAALFAIVGVAICFEASRLGFFSFGVPGAGLFPFMAGALLVLASLAAMVLPAEAGMAEESVPWRLQLLLALATALYFVLFEVLGVYIATALYMAGTILVIFRGRLLPVVITIAVSLTLIYLLFRVWLGTPLPEFPW